jgi:hypothetical protein
MTGSNGHQASQPLKEIETRLFINGEVSEAVPYFECGLIFMIYKVRRVFKWQDIRFIVAKNS